MVVKSGMIVAPLTREGETPFSIYRPCLALAAPFVAMILEETKPLKIILFGSGSRGDFDVCSDLDLVIVYGTAADAESALKTLYRKRPKSAHGVDFLCVDEATFAEKAQLGGVYF